MNAAWKKWLISLVFGVVIARFGYGFFSPAVLAQFGGATPVSGNVETIIIVSFLSQLLIIALVTAFLSRLEDNRKRIGWGCFILGLVVLAGLLATIFVSDISIFGIMQSGTETRNDEMTAFIFWLMVLVLPFAIGGLVLTILGWFLISRKSQNKMS
ncbi:hypothetical protein [Brucella gallinifaecis]|uniref:hypothetical protein n=1 Tax=Brucella gallinifaecis TaxID=215590 RepID=UPI002362A4EA|nr:hypothetical protein [Brucella gallinifaecis]